MEQITEQEQKVETFREQFPIPSSLNAFIITVQLLAFAASLYLLKHISSWYQLFALQLFFALLMNSIYSTIHEAHHRMLFRNRKLNDFAGMVLALFFPAPFHLLRQGHIGHHMRNRSDDEAFDLIFDHDNKIWKWLAWYGIITGCYWLLVVLSNFLFLFAPWVFQSKLYKWDRTSEAFMESLNPKYLRFVQIESFAAILFHLFIVLYFQLPITNYLLLYFAFGLSWSGMQYVHHYQAERDVLNGARNLFLCEPVDLLLLNHNSHLTHHRHPTVPWVHLEKLAKKEQTKKSFLPWYYLRMWRGPNRATESVTNRYAGRVIS